MAGFSHQVLKITTNRQTEQTFVRREGFRAIIAENVVVLELKD